MYVSPRVHTVSPASRLGVEYETRDSFSSVEKLSRVFNSRWLRRALMVIVLAAAILAAGDLGRHIMGQAGANGSMAASGPSAASSGSSSQPPASDSQKASTDDSQSSGQSSNSSSVNVQLNTENSSINGNNSSSASLKVNGQNVPVSGSNINKTFTSDDGQSTVHISVNNQEGGM